MLVSVVVPVLNAGPFLDEAIGSVLGQTLDAWELLLVDDGSTDGSAEAAQAWAARHPSRVAYLEHPGHANRGAGASRNLGLRAASGAIVAFLDADDVLRREALAEIVDLFAAHPEAAMVYGPLRRWFGWTGAAMDRARDYVDRVDVPQDRLLPPPLVVCRALRLHSRDVHCGVAVRRARALAVGGFDESFRGLYEDRLFCARIALRWPVYVASKDWWLYRQHPTSYCRSTSVSADHRLYWPRYLAEVEAVARRLYPAHLPLRRALRRAWRIHRLKTVLYRRPYAYRVAAATLGAAQSAYHGVFGAPRAREPLEPAAL